jgi:hypothetical protein
MKVAASFAAVFGPGLVETPSALPMLKKLELPVKTERFMRMLRDCDMRSETEHPSGVPTQKNAAQLSAAAHRRK